VYFLFQITNNGEAILDFFLLFQFPEYYISPNPFLETTKLQIELEIATHLYHVQAAYRTKWKAKGAEHIIGFRSTQVARMMIFTRSSKFAISSPHVILTLRLSWPLREYMFMLVIARLTS
jgi:hypothetical protein